MMVAICDDDRRFLRQVQDALEREGQPEDTVMAFDSGIALLEHWGKGPYPFDLTFLDIRMPGLGGLETARCIREAAPEATLVILTRYEAYALEAYQVRPFDYLMKPPSPSALAAIVEEARERVANRPGYTFTSGYQTITLPVHGIRYVESFDWALVLHYGEAYYRINDRLKHVRDALEPHGFLQVHRSFLVNRAHIQAVDRQRNTLTLASGEVIPVSKHSMKSVLTALIRHRTGVL